MNRRSLSSRERFIFILALAVLSAFFVFQRVWGPIHAWRINIRQNGISSQRDLEKMLSLIQESPVIEGEYAEYAAYFLQTQEDEAEMARLLSHVEAVASHLNVRLWEVKPQRIRPRDFYNDFSVHLMLEEDLLVMVHFLYTLQNPPYLFAVTEMRLEKSSPKKTSLKCYLVLSRTLIRNPA